KQLFTFGTCGKPLCLTGARRCNGKPFTPADTASGSSILSFISNAIGASVGNTPLTSASSGVTFQFEGGLPVKTSTSAGPIFGERAQTLGRGRFFVGANVTQMRFQRLRGIRVDDIEFNFTHEDTPPAGLGSPIFENDIVAVHVSLDVSLIVTSFAMSYGLVDGVDLSVDVPVVHTSVQGSSVANILPLGGFPDPHLNLGYAFRDGDLQNDAVIATLGFDQLLAPFATLAFDVLSDWQIGDSKLIVPGPVQYVSPYPHQVIPTNIPSQRDDLMSASL